MCGIAPMLMGETVENVAGGIDCYTLRQPLGVCAGICPFNFPAMVPLWCVRVCRGCVGEGGGVMPMYESVCFFLLCAQYGSVHLTVLHTHQLATS